MSTILSRAKEKTTVICKRNAQIAHNIGINILYTQKISSAICSNVTLNVSLNSDYKIYYAHTTHRNYLSENYELKRYKQPNLKHDA